MFRYVFLSSALLISLPAFAESCNLHDQLTNIGILTANLHLKVTASRHNELSSIISDRLKEIHDVDAQGFESAACDRAESLKAWIERESASPHTRTER